MVIRMMLLPCLARVSVAIIHLQEVHLGAGAGRDRHRCLLPLLMDFSRIQMILLR